MDLTGMQLHVVQGHSHRKRYLLHMVGWWRNKPNCRLSSTINWNGNSVLMRLLHGTMELEWEVYRAR
jgi:hypothetical protein